MNVDVLLGIQFCPITLNFLLTLYMNGHRGYQNITHSTRVFRKLVLTFPVGAVGRFSNKIPTLMLQGNFGL